MYCRNCGEKLEEDTKVCLNCGTKQFDDTTGTVTCKHCGEEIDADCIICPKCGKQVKEIQSSQPNIIINNSNENINRNTSYVVSSGRQKNKWLAFCLCFFLGFLGAHKFYEGKTGQGILYLLTLGIFGFGWFFDTIAILFKPNPYYV